MKRIVSACIEQTLCFDTSKEADPQEDFKHFLAFLDKKRIKHEIMDTQIAADGSLIVKIKRRFNKYSTEGYIA